MYLGLELYSRILSRKINIKKYYFDVFEYFPKYFYKKPQNPKTVFTLDVVDLAYSTARTICSYHLDKKELYFDVIASLMSHLNFIDTNQNNFLLCESRYQRLRDFSKSAQIGEMAQGINALFVAKTLGFPYIIDFDLATKKTSQTLKFLTTGKTPDFIIVNKKMTQLGLFESKGTMTRALYGKYGVLSQAMNQIDAVSLPCFDYEVPVCTKFEHNNDVEGQPIPANRKSSINYSLITRECFEAKETSLLIKLHYASWFYLVGDFERVVSILQEGTMPPIEENDPIYELDLDTDKENPIYWVKENIIRNVFSEGVDFHMVIYGFIPNEKSFKIGIYKKVVESLVYGNQTIFEFPQDSTSYLRRYPDGTLLYLRLEDF